jgi:hypothetical protein
MKVPRVSACTKSRYGGHGRGSGHHLNRLGILVLADRRAHVDAQGFARGRRPSQPAPQSAAPTQDGDQLVVWLLKRFRQYDAAALPPVKLFLRNLLNPHLRLATAAIKNRAYGLDSCGLVIREFQGELEQRACVRIVSRQCARSSEESG